MKRRDQGYAMLAAIVGIAAFSYVAFEVIAENRGIVSSVQGENEHANLMAAADAGLALAVNGLASTDKRNQWTIDGSPRNAMFDDVALTITIEDERGKIPLNGINEDQVRAMFAAAGATTSELDTLVDSYEDWIDPDDDRRANGAELQYYAPFGYGPRNSPFHSIGELRLLKGMNDSILERVAPAVTVFFGESGGFSEGTAQILALQALEELPPKAPRILDRMKQLQGLEPAPDVANPPSLIGRTLRVQIEARRAGAYARRSAIVELTGNAANPFWIREAD